jgi:hypothetical protein
MSIVITYSQWINEAARLVLLYNYWPELALIDVDYSAGENRARWGWNSLTYGQQREMIQEVKDIVAMRRGGVG